MNRGAMASKDRVAELADLRRGAEQHGEVSGTLAKLLGRLGFSELDSQTRDRVNETLTTAGLRSTPSIDVGLPLDSVLRLSLINEPSRRDATSDTEGPGGLARDGVLELFDTENPYLQRLFAHELFGVAPDRCAELFRGIETVVPDERLITAMRVRHGLAEGGVLMITTHWLRYAKQGRMFTAISNDEFWPLDGALDLEAPVGGRPLFTTPDGNQFQVFPTVPIVSRRQAKLFLSIYKLAALAIHHLNTEREDSALRGLANAAPTGTVAEIKELVALRDSGALSESEFDAAKARVLRS
jgi:hypothetical protein